MIHTRLELPECIWSIITRNSRVYECNYKKKNLRALNKKIDEIHSWWSTKVFNPSIKYAEMLHADYT